jgi:hypothetical protein
VTIPDDALAGAVSILLVAVVLLARALARVTERVARLEGRLNGRAGRPPRD